MTGDWARGCGRWMARSAMGWLVCLAIGTASLAVAAPPTPRTAATPTPRTAAKKPPAPIRRAPTAVPTPAVTVSPAGPLQYADHARQIFERGRRLGNRARVFSKMGDSTTADQPFLYGFGLGTYHLGWHPYLQATIDFFSISPRAGYTNSFTVKSIAAMPAFNAVAAFDPTWTVWTDPDKLCRADEGPLACEMRLNKPSVIIIMVGLEDMFVNDPGTYRQYLGQIIQTCIDQGVIPVLNTFAAAPRDKPEAGTNAAHLNDVVRELSAAYQVPLISLREAVSKLPDGGLNYEGIHLSDWGNAYSFNGDQDRWGITLRNLLTLQMLDRLRIEVLSR